MPSLSPEHGSGLGAGEAAEVAATEAEGALPTTLRVAYALSALGFLGGAASHVARGWAAAPDDPSSPARHALFVAIDVLAAAGMLWRPRWLVVPFALLFAHQLTTHGVQTASALRAGEAPLLVDGLVSLFMPAVFGLLIHNAVRGRAKRAPLAQT